MMVGVGPRPSGVGSEFSLVVVVVVFVFVVRCGLSDDYSLLSSVPSLLVPAVRTTVAYWD
jgi:hypothetical protein